MASLALAGFNGSYDDGPQAIFGYCLVVLVVIIGLVPDLAQEPDVFGAYWAYVFPLAALASCSVKMAVREDTQEAKALAWVLIIISQVGAVIVFCRMSWHHLQVTRGRAEWKDPLFTAYMQKQREMQDSEQTNEEHATKDHATKPAPRHNVVV